MAVAAMTLGAMTLGALATLPGPADAASGDLTYVCSYGALATDVPTTVSIDTDAPITPTTVGAVLDISTTLTLTVPDSVVDALAATPGFTGVTLTASGAQGLIEDYVAPGGVATPVTAHPALAQGTPNADGSVPFTGTSPAPYHIQPGPSTPGAYAIEAGNLIYQMDVAATTPATYLLSCTAPAGSPTIDTVKVVAPTTTTLTMPEATWEYGGTGPVATAAVGPVGGGPGWPAASGSVQFYADGHALGAAVPLVAGTATLAQPVLGLGSHQLTATYLPDAASFYTTSSTLPPASSVTVETATTTVLAVAPEDPEIGDPATATATVTGGDGSAAPGAVTFLVDGEAIGTAELTGGVASIALPTEVPGRREVTASYRGSGLYLSSASDAVALDVGVPATVTTLALNATSAPYGLATTATATVTSDRGTPTGTITFTIGPSSVSAPVVNGTARVALPTVAPTTYQVVATFVPTSADAFGGSTATPVTLTVVKDATLTRQIVEHAKRGRRLVSLVTVRAVHGTAVTGKVTLTLKRHGRVVQRRTVTVAAGRAVVRFRRLAAAGRWSVKARYAGSSTLRASSSVSHLRAR